MPGVAQVWLTQEELDALVLAAPTKSTRVSDGLWRNIEPKLTAARNALGCPVPQVDEFVDVNHATRGLVATLREIGGLSDVA